MSQVQFVVDSDGKRRAAMRGTVEFQLTSAPGEPDQWRITRADPHIDIAASLLRARRTTDYISHDPEHDTITLTDDYGHRYIYRITSCDDPDVWHAAWPD